MLDPRFDIQRILKDVLAFLKYTWSGHKSNDSILLAIVQFFDNVGWDDILIGQDIIEWLFTTYKAPNGFERKVMLGKSLNFILGTFYA